MSEMPPVNKNTTQVIVRHTLGCSEPVLDIRTRNGSSQAIKSPDPISLLPVSAISNTSTNGPLRISVQCISARRVEYTTISTGALLSVPVTCDLPHSNQNENITQYQEGYDTDGEIVPSFDSIANQREDDDEAFDGEEHGEAAENIEPKKKTDQDKVRGTPKAAVLTGDPDILDLVAFSVYDTKPVHFLFMAGTGLKWIEKKKKSFDSGALIKHQHAMSSTGGYRHAQQWHK